MRVAMPMEKLTSGTIAWRGPTDLAGGLQAQCLGSFGGGQVIGATEPDGEFGIAGAAQQIGRTHRALQQHGGAAQRLVARRHRPEAR